MAASIGLVRHQVRYILSEGKNRGIPRRFSENWRNFYAKRQHIRYGSRCKNIFEKVKSIIHSVYMSKSKPRHTNVIEVLKDESRLDSTLHIKFVTVLVNVFG